VNFKKKNSMDLSLNTKEYILRYEKYPHILEGYNNANWIAYFEESKSTNRYILTLGGAAISLKSSKKNLHSPFHNGIKIYCLK